MEWTSFCPSSENRFNVILFLTPVDAYEICGFIISHQRSQVPCRIALPGALYLDYVRAQVCQDHGAKRSGQKPGQVKDSYAAQWSGHSTPPIRSNDMKVERVSWQGFSIPFRKPYVTSQGVFDTRYGLLLFLHGDNGSVGMGEASPVGAGSREEVKAVGTALGQIAPQLLATEPLSATGMPPLPEWNAPPVLRFGIETALLDLRGKALVRNVSELLNGAAKSLPVNALIAAETPKEAASEAKEAANAGFGSIKLKVGLESAELDEALVSAVRQAVGTEIKVRIDANRKWGLPEAVAGLRCLEQYDIEYVEDPLKGNDSGRPGRTAAFRCNPGGIRRSARRLGQDATPRCRG